MQTNAKGKKTALYCRLSKDDERFGESVSIETQKAMLVQYAQESGLAPYEFYIDDGYTGLNFDRPDFQRMLDDIAAGKVHTIVTKDLSRLGRDHLMVGHYTEIYFPTNGIRYVALNDGVDTSVANSNDYAAIKNVMNEMYSRDSSRKIKAAIRARAKQGKYRSTVAPFGYVKDPSDHNHLLPDPETAGYVKTIFELCAAGYGNWKIREYLRKNKIPNPSWFHHSRGLIDKSRMFPDEQSRYMWRPDTLRLLIRNRVYIGDTVNCKSSHIFKTTKHPRTDESEWIVVEGTHEPLVSRELFDIANEVVSVKRQSYKESLTGAANPFKGLLKCADCGKAMTRRRNGSASGHIIYVCSAYATYGKERCSHHKVFEEDLRKAVLGDIRGKARLALESKDELVAAIVRAGFDADGRSLEARKKTHQKDVNRLATLERLVVKLYEDVASGRVTQSNFDMMIGKYQAEQESLMERVGAFDEDAEAYSDRRTNAEMCADLLARHSEIEELTPEIMNTLVKRIEVHEPTVVDGVSRQRVDIYYRYAGLVDDNEFDKLTFYHTKGVERTTRKRAERRKRT